MLYPTLLITAATILGIDYPESKTMFEEEAEDDILDFDCKPKNLFQSKVFEEELKVNSPIVDNYRKIKPIKLQKRKVKIPNKPRSGDLLKSLEESFNLQTSDLPDMKDFFSFERKVFERKYKSLLVKLEHEEWNIDSKANSCYIRSKVSSFFGTMQNKVVG